MRKTTLPPKPPGQPGDPEDPRLRAARLHDEFLSLRRVFGIFDRKGSDLAALLVASSTDHYQPLDPAGEVERLKLRAAQIRQVLSEIIPLAEMIGNLVAGAAATAERFEQIANQSKDAA